MKMTMAEWSNWTEWRSWDRWQAWIRPILAANRAKARLFDASWSNAARRMLGEALWTR